ncbi:hypothetical protein IWQ56_002172 [Coemansia nantahalensis]|nr:hypothetical protein IWQ56_002172 [Coemansia nantahalensis]
MKSFTVSSVIALVGALAGLASAHMDMISPCPRYNPNCASPPPVPPGKALDSNIKAPISSVAAPSEVQPLCKHTVPWAAPVANWTAGQSVTVGFHVNYAGHGGGHCQFSMSYDGGKTFAVVHEELKHCFFTGPANSNDATVFQYTFTLPKDLPSSDTAIFAWSWVNAIGNREFYMNCADVAIKGTSQSYTGKKMVVANYPGYPTIPEFGGNYDTGLDLYKSQPMVTVNGNGGSAPAPDSAPAPGSAPGKAGDAPAAAPSSTYVPVPLPPKLVMSSAGAQEESTTCDATPTSSAPAVGSAAAPAPTSGANDSYSDKLASGGGACQDGTLQCAGTGYQICMGGQWSPQYACGPGTACKGTGGSVFCGFA